MERVNIFLKEVFSRFKKVILILLIGISGLLLTFSGVGLIELTPSLTLYSGIALLIMTVLIYLFT